MCNLVTENQQVGQLRYPLIRKRWNKVLGSNPTKTSFFGLNEGILFLKMCNLVTDSLREGQLLWRLIRKRWSTSHAQTDGVQQKKSQDAPCYLFPPKLQINSLLICVSIW